MSTRATSWIAGSVLALTLPPYVLSVWFGFSRPEVDGVPAFTGDDLLWIASFVLFELVGAVIVMRRPSHPVGWLFLATGGASVASVAAYEYAIQALLLGVPLPGAAVAAWMSAWTWAPPLGLLVVALVVFPTGSPPSRRWWPLVWLVGSCTTIVTLANAIDLWSVRGAVLLQDPESLSPEIVASLWSYRVVQVVFPLILLAAVAAMVGVVIRYRSAGDTERQQLKLLAFVAGVAATGLVISEGFDAAGPLGRLAGLVALPGWFAIASGVAILRYRLYEIDRVISRTVTYAAVVVGLGGLYAVSVLVLGRVLAPLGAGGDLAVAGSTLAAAALFRPALTRVRSVVDRRFNRARYDAARTVETFTQRLRDEIDRDALIGDLRTVAAATLHPRHASVWVAPGDRDG